MTLKCTFAALMAAALLAPSARAQTPEELKAAITKLEKAAKDLQDAKDALKIDDLRARITKMESTLELLDKDFVSLKQDIREIKRKLDLNGTSGTGGSVKSESLYPGQGRVRFINEFAEDMSVVVNGQSYRLLPGQERLIPVTPGDYTYQVLQLQRTAQTRTIAANETKTVRIFPLQ